MFSTDFLLLLSVFKNHGTFSKERRKVPLAVRVRINLTGA
jgi:hypothetical protein